jgi:hypothetical protein
MLFIDRTSSAQSTPLQGAASHQQPSIKLALATYLDPRHAPAAKISSPGATPPSHERLFLIKSTKDCMLRTGERTPNDAHGIPYDSAWMDSTEGPRQILGFKRTDGTFEPAHAQTGKPLPFGRRLLATPSAIGDLIFEKSGLNGGGPLHYEYSTQAGTKYWFRPDQPGDKKFYYDRTWHGAPPMDGGQASYHSGEGNRFWFDPSKPVGQQFGYWDGWHAAPPAAQLPGAKPEAIAYDTGPFAGSAIPSNFSQSTVNSMPEAPPRRSSNVAVTSWRQRHFAGPVAPRRHITVVGRDSTEHAELAERFIGMKISSTPGAYPTEKPSPFKTPSQALDQSSYSIRSDYQSSRPEYRGAPTLTLTKDDGISSLHTPTSFSTALIEEGYPQGVVNRGAFMAIMKLIDSRPDWDPMEARRNLMTEFLQGIDQEIQAGTSSEVNKKQIIEDALRVLVDAEVDSEPQSDVESHLRNLIYTLSVFSTSRNITVDQDLANAIPLRRNEMTQGDIYLLRIAGVELPSDQQVFAEDTVHNVEEE